MVNIPLYLLNFYFNYTWTKKKEISSSTCFWVYTGGEVEMQHCGNPVVVDGILMEVVYALHCTEAGHAHYSLRPHLMVLPPLVYGMSAHKSNIAFLKVFYKQ